MSRPGPSDEPVIELIGTPDRPEGDRGGRVGRRDWLLLVAIVVVLLAAFGRSVDRFSRSAPEARGPDQEHDQRADDVVGAMEGVGSSPTAAESPTEVQPTTDPTASVRGGAVRVGEFGGPALATPTSFELLAHTTDALIRFWLSSGEVTRTKLPAIDSTGPVYLVASGDAVLVRPWDDVTGYRVIDGDEVEELGGRLAGGVGVVGLHPGPEPDQLWMPDERQPGLDLVDVTSDEILGHVSSDLVFVAVPDGDGGVIRVDVEGAALVRPDGIVPITDQALRAAGPGRWLIQECEPEGCSDLVVDAETGSRTVLRSSDPWTGGWIFGVVSPAGRAAALPGLDGSIEVVDLGTGETVALPTSGAVLPLQGLVWSSDDRFLFFVADGSLFVFDRTAATVERLWQGSGTVDAITGRDRQVP